MGIGSVKDLMRIPKIMESMGYEISWEKYNINQKFVSYCQMFGIMPEHNPLSKERGKQEGRLDKFIQVDTPKIRCLGQFQKMGGSENFDKPDPLVGKATMLYKDVAYMKDTLGIEREGQEPSLGRFFQRLRSYIGAQAIFVRLLMPSWMEWKVFRNPMTYLPPEFGGLGLTIPGGLDIKNVEKAKELAHKFSLKTSQPKWDETKKEWERGITVTNILINRMIDSQKFADVLDEETLKEVALAEIKSDLAAGSDVSIGQYRLWKHIGDKYTCLDREIPLVTSKENAYVTLAIHPDSELQVARKRRCRQILADNLRVLSRYTIPDESEFNWEKPRAAKRYVKTSTLHEAFGTWFVKPSLRIAEGVFDKRRASRLTFCSNTESVREMEEPGSFDIDIDESQRPSGTESSDNV